MFNDPNDPVTVPRLEDKLYQTAALKKQQLRLLLAPPLQPLPAHHTASRNTYQSVATHCKL